MQKYFIDRVFLEIEKILPENQVLWPTGEFQIISQKKCSGDCKKVKDSFFLD